MKNFFTLIFCFLTISFYAQTTTSDSIYVVKKANGVELIGKLISDDGREVLLLTDKMGKVYIAKSDIISMKLIEEGDVVNGEYIEEGPFTTRYSFTTNAFPVKQGENYAMINLYGPEIHFAVTDKFNLGLMTTWYGSPFAFAGKYAFPTSNKNMHFSLGGLVGSSGFIANFKGYGSLFFGNATFGNRKLNITTGIGYSYFSSFGSKQIVAPGVYTYDYTISGPNYTYSNVNNGSTKGPAISVGAYAKIGKKTGFVLDFLYLTLKNYATESIQTNYQQDPNNPTLVSETWVKEENIGYPGHVLVFMPGIRVQGKTNSAFQFNLSGVSMKFDNPNAFIDRLTIPFPSFSWFYKF
jgi:hypothetical protein